MGLFSRNKKSAANTINSGLQDQLSELQNRFDELEEENLSLYYEKSIIDSNGSEPIAGQFGLVDEQYDKAMLQKLFMTETWFYIAVNTIARTISSLPFVLEKKKIIRQNVTQANGEVEEVFKETWIEASAEPEANLFRYPNEYQTQMEFVYLVVADLLATGDAYLHPLKDQIRTDDKPLDRLRNAIQGARHTDVEQILRINSAQVEVVPSEEEGEVIAGYALISNADTIGFKPEEMVHIKLPNPSSPLYGLAPVVAVMKKVLLDRYTDEHHIRFYKQGARLGGAIETTKKLTKEQMQRLTKTFESNFTGKRQHHKTLILPEGMKYKIIEQTPVDSSLIEFAKTNKEPILAAYNVPPIKVGLLDGATFANALIQNKTYYVDTIMPLTKLIEQAINQSDNILKSTRNIRFRFDFSQVEALQEDFKAKADSAKGMADSGMTINEVRQEVWNLPPIEGGDVTPALRQGGGMTLLSAPAPTDQKVDTANAQNDTEANSDIVPTEASFESRVAQLVNQAVSEGLDIGVATERAVAQALQEGFIPKPLEPQEEDKALLKSPFSKDALVTYAKRVNGPAIDPYIKERTEEYEAFMKRLEAFIIKKLKRKAYRKTKGFGIKVTIPSPKDMKGFIEQESERIANSLLKASNHGFKANIPSRSITFPNDKALTQLKKVSARNVRSVTKTSIKQLKNIISSSVSDQTSVGEVSARIQDAFKDITASKAETIARTETLSAVSIGQDLKSKEFKRLFPKESNKLLRVWIDANDDKVRDSHAENDGKVVKVGEEYPNGLKYPRDPSGDASEIINCRCSFIDFLPEDMDDILDILG